mmetsp:Transcript_24767/g.51502  ORF Transcript_24767/g.51502 Transcript_24767/m.51502 type:complete len:237 (-) Transcript_24767:89-799(-)
MSSTTTTTPMSFWEAYNSDDTYWPLYLPLGLWISTYVYCLWTDTSPKGTAFQKWVALHNFHNIGAMVWATCSIQGFGNVNERVPILWSLGYFVVDSIDCVVRRDVQYLFHAACCLILGLANYQIPILFRLKMNSKATYCEMSNPFMHLAKSTRNPVHFALFALVFTCCRIVWLPIMYRQCLDEGMAWNHPILIVLAGFYGLNLFWYVKILKILYQGIMGTTELQQVNDNGDKKKQS